MEELAKTSQRASSRPRDYLDLIRPAQWVKNVVVFAGPAAGLKLTDAASLTQAVLAFAAFCLAAGATYAINDAMDREADARHPTKRYRPVARGAIQPAAAMWVGVVLVGLAVALSVWQLNPWVTTVLVLYFATTLAYSLVLKSQMLLDVIAIATGFVLRAWAGSLAVGVDTSKWLVACVFTLCLFMGFGKRRCELAMIGNMEEARRHRRTLVRYTPDLLNHLITVSAGIAVIAFLLYTLDTGGSAPPFAKEQLFYTLPLVVYGIFRYAMLTELGIYSGPTEIVLKDRPLVITVAAWAMVALLIAYQETLFGPGGIEGLMET